MCVIGVNCFIILDGISSYFIFFVVRYYRSLEVVKEVRNMGYVVVLFGCLMILVSFN